MFGIQDTIVIVSFQQFGFGTGIVARHGIGRIIGNGSIFLVAGRAFTSNAIKGHAIFGRKIVAGNEALAGDGMRNYLEGMIARF
jgi:hypothetical protein